MSGHETFPWFSFVGLTAQAQVQEISLEQAKRQMESLPETVLMDVREDHEWLSEHAAGAVHLGKGIWKGTSKHVFLTDRHPSSCIVEAVIDQY